MGHNPLTNPVFWVLLLPLSLVWTGVSFYFLRNFLRRRNLVSLMLAAMPLGHLVAALRELHLLNRLSTTAVLCASLTVGLLTAWVCAYNAIHYGAAR